MTHDERILSLGVSILSVIELFLFVSLAGAWLGLLGSWSWWLDLFSHFRLQHLAVSVVALVWFAWRRHRMGSGFALATLLLNAALLIFTGWPLSNDRIMPGARLRVVSLNVLTSNHRKNDALAFLRSSNADVIFAMEVDAAWVAALQPLTKSHPHHLIEPREDNFGVALYSKLPPHELRLLDVGSIGLPSVMAKMTHEGESFTLIATHPLPPTSAENSALRDEQLRDIAKVASSLSGPVLLIGDLNVTPSSHGMNILRNNSALDFHSTQHPWSPTWQTGTPFAISIDHALTTLPLVITARTVGPDVGSDHLPLLVEVGILSDINPPISPP